MGKDLLGDIEIIKDLDISCVASLVGKDELTELGVKNLSENISSQNIKFIQFEIKNFGIPTTTQYEELKSFINEIKDNIISGKNVFVHCMAGLGRTGMIAALVLAKLGISINQSITIIRDTRPGSIETAEQEGFVRNFKLN